MSKNKIAVLITLALFAGGAAAARAADVAHAEDDKDALFFGEQSQSRQPFTVGDFQYVPLVFEGRVKRFKIMRNGKTILLQTFEGDEPKVIQQDTQTPLDKLSPEDPMSLYYDVFTEPVFPYAKAHISTELHLGEEAGVGGKCSFREVTGDTRATLPAINNLAGGKDPCLIVLTARYPGKYQNYMMFKLADTVTELPGLHYGGSELIGENQGFAFGDFNGKGQLQALGIEPAFADWVRSEAGSWPPSVILTLTSSGWRLALDDMRLPPIAREVIAEAARKHRQRSVAHEKEYPKDKDQFFLEPGVWGDMLWLVYTGHAADAWSLVDQFWPAGKRATHCYDITTENPYYGPVTKAQFLQVFKRNLQHSPFWRDLLLLNDGQGLSDFRACPAGARDTTKPNR